MTTTATAQEGTAEVVILIPSDCAFQTRVADRWKASLENLLIWEREFSIKMCTYVLSYGKAAPVFVVVVFYLLRLVTSKEKK